MTPFDLLKKIYELIPDGFSVRWSHQWSRHHNRCVVYLTDERGNAPNRAGIVIEDQWIRSVDTAGDISMMLEHLIANAIDDMKSQVV